jgi:hypothetical protein
VNQKQKPDTDFEQRLLAQLRAVVAERAVAEAASGVEGGAAIAPARWRPNARLALAGAGALAAIVAGILVLSSGPPAEPAAAEVLRHTAAVAAAGDHPEAMPGPGQFLYMKTKRLELQGWIPGELTIGGGLVSQKGAFNALIPWQEEAWRSADEPSRTRLVMGTPNFLSSADQSRWENAGSPLPGLFSGEEGGFPGAHVIEVGRGVRDVEAMDGPGFRDFSNFPTEPEALRLAIEHRQASGSPNHDGPAAKPLDTGQVIAELWDILDKPNTTPALRAAVFGALAELPGIELNRDARDLVGRSGSALSYESSESSAYGEEQPGIRVEYIFDPETAELLGRREILADPEMLSSREGAVLGYEVPGYQGVPAGTVRREVAYLESGIVDSTHERPDERNGEPVATTSPTYRR